MLRSLLGAARADIDRQIRWAKYEVQRQTHYAALKGILVGAAALAAIGAIVVGLMALYFWLEVQIGVYGALGVIGGGLLVLAMILSALAFLRARPRPASRPQLQIMQPSALVGVLSRDRVSDSSQTLELAAGPMRRASRPALLGMLVLAAIAGLVAGRRL
jgi:hypothetical protein